ncbi:MAG TPA: isochorismatase family cysteine hydrolase [Gaiellaceae bacterium]|nr:isochorismatase family cysteine hydrolase [Gaiellaceae bacterium]
MGRALLLVDVLKDFDHEDGERLLASFRERHAALALALEEARSAGTPVVYANDDAGGWDSDAPALLRRARAGPGGDLVAAIAPRPGDRVVLKPRYSAFDETPLGTILAELDVDELVLAGTATEMCVFQTATDALRRGHRVTVLADACATVDEENEALALAYLERIAGVRVGRRG